MTNFPGLRGRELVLQTLDELQADLAAGAEWENDRLDRFLEAFAALLGSIENAYANAGEQVPNDAWTILARVFLGARYYE